MLSGVYAGAIFLHPMICCSHRHCLSTRRNGTTVSSSDLPEANFDQKMKELLCKYVWNNTVTVCTKRCRCERWSILDLQSCLPWTSEKNDMRTHQHSTAVKLGEVNVSEKRHHNRKTTNKTCHIISGVTHPHGETHPHGATRVKVTSLQ